jgi:hypothetical protein
MSKKNGWNKAKISTKFLHNSKCWIEPKVSQTEGPDYLPAVGSVPDMCIAAVSEPVIYPSALFVFFLLK